MLSSAHAALAVIHSDYEWNWKQAESEFKLLACYLPALRAGRIDPLVALRAD